MCPSWFLEKRKEKYIPKIGRLWRYVLSSFLPSCRGSSFSVPRSRYPRQLLLLIYPRCIRDDKSILLFALSAFSSYIAPALYGLA